MGPIKLELKLRSPNNISGITITMDPKPDWNLNELISELNSLELKHYNAAAASSSSSSKQSLFVKTQARDFSNKKEFSSRRSSKPFVMHISDDEESDDDEENQDPNLVVGTRFACEKLYLSDSDSSEDELAIVEETQASNLMEPVGLLEGLLSQEEIENQKLVQENTRHEIGLLEMDLINENERSLSGLTQLEKLTEARREMARKLDTQYRRKIAEALDNHLNAVQRNHEQKSQLEERKLRNDAANEEAKKKEKERVFHEEKLRQEKAKQEAEAVKRKAEEAQKDALEAARRTKEAAEKKASETANMFPGEGREKGFGSMTGGTAEVLKEKKNTGTTFRAAERALIIEEERAQKYNELVEKNRAMKLIKDYRPYELLIGRHIRQITGTREAIRTKVNELIKIMNDPLCPQSISIATFAKKVISNCESSGANFDGTAFACGQVIVQVTSKAPLAMDLLLAEFHKACIFSVPKYVVKSESGISKEAYLKLLGYREEDGKLESEDNYLGRLEAYMKLYGAIVQTEINGVRNLHGLEEGWAWLARLLNFLPANIYTAVALEAFIKMAGFALFRRYKSQFKKILNIISQHFVRALEERGDAKLNPIIMKLKFYIDTNQYSKEPEGWRIETSLLSDIVEPEPQPSRYYRY